jgi:peptidoglycan/LPS O-acetylase OafA/YrhL
VAELDGMRAVAALAVVAYHLYPGACAWGRTGVDLFFVLSGYLITGILLRHRPGGGMLGAFHARRALRIWPIYYLALLACVALNGRLEGPPPLAPAGLAYHLSFTQNVPLYWSAAPPPFAPALLHTWTLALEEQFYLIWPALVALAGRRRGAVALLALAAAALAVAARARGFAPTLLLTRCDGFALGGLLAALLAAGGRRGRPPRRARGPCAAVAAVAGAGGVAWEGHLLPAWDPLKSLAANLFFAAAVGLVVGDAGRPWLAPLRDRRLGYLGRISYGIYLYHLIVIVFATDFARRAGLPPRGPLPDLALVAATLALAAASWELLERPLLRLKDHFPYQAPGGRP